MTVKQLIAQLQQVDGDLLVCVEVGDYGDALAPATAVNVSNQGDYIDSRDYGVPIDADVVVIA